MKEDLRPRQKTVKAYIAEYGIHAAVSGTGLPLCSIRATYTDEEPVYDHLVRVYQFYRGLAYERLRSDDDDDF